MDLPNFLPLMEQQAARVVVAVPVSKGLALAEIELSEKAISVAMEETRLATIGRLVVVAVALAASVVMVTVAAMAAQVAPLLHQVFLAPL